MTGFRFKAHTPDGKTYQGVLQATSVEDVRRTLARQKLIADHVRPEPDDRSFHLRRTPTQKALVQFSRQFATLIDAAVPLVLSLQVLQGLTEDRPLRAALARVTADIEGGATFADALRKQPRAFSEIAVSMIDAGEQGGTLDVTLNRLADYMERAQEIRERVRGALIYPALILSVAVASVVALLTLVVPTFQGMFAASGMDLPFATLVLVDSSRFLAEYAPLIVVTVLLLVLVTRTLHGTTRGRLLLHRIVLSTPVFGRLASKSSVARFSRTMASLLNSGVHLLEALSAASRTTGNAVLERAVLKARDGIAQGFGVSASLAMSPHMPNLVPRMVGVGEQTGRLNEMFAKVADFYEREVDAEVEGLLKALEPALVVLVGILLGGMVIAMYLPIFDAVGAVDPTGLPGGGL